MSSRRFLATIVTGIIIVAGCAPKIETPTRICQGKKHLFDSIAALRLCAPAAPSLKANGQCLLQYYNQGKKHKENFPVKLWVNPPVEMYLQGDVAFNPKGIVLGSNESEFWLAIKPKEISSYWWGKWAEQDRFGKLPVSPKILLEALGVAAIETDEDWSLSNEGLYDVLTKRSQDGKVIKKIYIYCCDYLVRKIEYFDSDGRVGAVAELSNYRKVCEEFSVPMIIRITRSTGNSNKDSVRITLRSVKPMEFSRKQREVIFNRPEPRGFEHAFVIIDGKPIELRL